ncbi:MATE family efflux transporter [Croceicoccus naphthovorans]|uniref:Multidrug transporter MatE n=1 Tax=Croceicoccus naphthovorans TaxID=1348774 RepID=A0A0G3XJP2_9SPHN|nr:MATE family efflux transporter [Croceicoccus naphthovorans]AKM10819.1 multidrug transporter MatE [Croceicoccus naphthovorans]MBB3989029.1 putative MATE family efflux protein [Croceicoccus naphthovorans]
MTRPELKGDLTQGPILKTLLAFSLPTLLTNLLQSVNGTVNAIWVGKLIGEEALAATANANIVMFLIFSAAFGFGMAGTVRIGQRYGGRDLDGSRRTFGTSVAFCALVGAFVAIVGWLAAPALLHMLDTPGAAYGLALTYLRVIFISMPFGIVTIVIAMSLRGTGDARTPLIFMALSVAIDVMLNPLLITGAGPLPEMGIAGSAMSTLSANLISLLALLAFIYRRDLPLRLRGAELGYLLPKREELSFILAKGLPMGAQMLVVSAAGIIVVGLVNREGLVAAAAYGAAMQLFTYVQMPAMAISAAVSAMAAQYIGAGKMGELDQVTRSGSMLNAGLTGAITVLVLVFDRPALGLFLEPGGAALELARHIQYLSAWSFILFGVMMVYTGTLRAGGVVWRPLLVMAIALYPARLGFYAVAYPLIGADAIWLSFPVGSFVSLVLAYGLYRFGNWRDKAQAVARGLAAEQATADAEPTGRPQPTI